MTKAFDMVNIHQLIHKIHNTHIPTTKIKFLANYLKGCRRYTSYNNHTSKHTNIKAGVPQGASYHPLSSTYTSQTYHSPKSANSTSSPTQMTSPYHSTPTSTQPPRTSYHTSMKYTHGLTITTYKSTLPKPHQLS